MRARMDEKIKATVTDRRMPAKNVPVARLLWFALSAFTLLAGLCTIFALVVTVIQAWIEHNQAQWPEVTAQVKKCEMAVYRSRSLSYWIACSLTFDVGGEPVLAHFHSGNTPAPQRVIWASRPYQFDYMQAWVDQHPPGSPITVHYNPAKRSRVVYLGYDIPATGPRTPSNVKLLEFFAIGFVVLFAIARFTYPGMPPKSECASDAGSFDR
jgi:Protein of unknown function (DUF3592)